MCDTIVATHDVTASGATLFAKNSDRQPNEAQHILCLPACDHAEGTRLRLTNIEIPQASHTHAVLLSKPFWMWGAEMGANEHGLAIGNEAVFTKIPYSKEPGMLGMDLLRLGLERGRAAAEARWLESIREAAPPGYPGWTYARAWNGRDQKARIPPL